MSSFEGYCPEGFTVMKEGEAFFSKSFAMLTRLDRNLPVFNLCLQSHLEEIQLLVVNSHPRTIPPVPATSSHCRMRLNRRDAL